MHRMRGANKRERDEREQKHVTLCCCASAGALVRTRYSQLVNHRTVGETSFGKCSSMREPYSKRFSIWKIKGKAERRNDATTTSLRAIHDTFLISPPPLPFDRFQSIYNYHACPPSSPPPSPPFSIRLTQRHHANG